jgi:hypothetical protein
MDGTTPVKATVKRERKVSMYSELRQANFVLLKNAKLKRDGYIYEHLSCIIMTAFSFEAFMNDLGSKILPYWNKIERVSHEVKMSILSDRIRLVPDYSMRPYQTISEVFFIRNTVAHGKPQTLSTKPTQEFGSLESMRRNKPLLKWEKKCADIKFAERAIKDSDKVIDEMLKSADLEYHDVVQNYYFYEISDHQDMSTDTGLKAKT